MKKIKQNPMYWYLLVLTVASAGGLHGWRTMFNNFAVEVVGLNGFQVGAIQSAREIPGFLALCAIFLILFIKEHRLSAFSVMLMGTGILLTGFFPTFTGLIATTLIMSFGFHYYETTNQSLILQHFDEYQSPLVMGKQRSLMSLVSIMVGLCIFSFSHFLSYKGMFFGLGAIVLGAGVWGFINEPPEREIARQHKRMVLRKKYTLFYLLTLLSGARRQIFMVFSVLLLVQKFGFTISQITILFVINNLINYYLAPLIARAIKQFGERCILSIEYSSLIFIFITYALCHQKWIVALLYIIDHITFNGMMAIRTYFQKIADPKDISSNTAVSFTINHLAAVVLPIVGGYLWMIDYKIPFFCGAGIGLISLIIAQFVNKQAQ